MKRLLHLVAAIAIASIVAPLPAQPAPAGIGLVPGSELRPLIERYSTDVRALRRFYWIRSSPLRVDRVERFHQEWQDRLETVDFDGLSSEGRVDYVLLRTLIDQQLHDATEQRARFEEVAELLPFASEVVGLEEERWAMEPIDPKAKAEIVSAITEAVEATEAKVEEQLENKEEISKVYARRAASIVDELVEGLEGWYDYYAGYEPTFGWWVDAPNRGAKEALESYASVLREKVVGIVEGEDEPLVGDPIGRQALVSDLAGEMIPYGPEGLIALAEADLAWCRQQMIEAAREMGYGDDWRAALEKVKNDYVGPGEQPALVRRVAEEAIAFLDDHDLVTIPDLARETWRLEMISAENQKLWPFAYYGGQHMAVAYPTDEMDHARKLEAMRGNNIHFTRTVTQHELIPGHHLQGFMAQRYRPYRHTFGTPFLGEGWALYWEMLLYDLGFPRTPEERIGMLLWRSHRGARVIVSLGFHLGEWTPQEMIDFLVEEIGLEPDSATGEVRRYIKGDYGPLYQCAYLIGGLQLRALRQEIVESGAMTDREFHDAVLRQNRIPIEMIRASLTGAPLTRNYRSSWRFGEGLGTGD